MKGASLSFLFSDIWSLSGFSQGKYLHILNSLMNTPSKHSIVPFDAVNDVTINQFKFDSLTRLIISLDWFVFNGV